MTTRDRLVKYRELHKTNPEAAEKFLEENKNDERFVSLVQLRGAFFSGFQKRLIERMRLSAEEKHELQRAFELEMMRGMAEVVCGRDRKGSFPPCFCVEQRARNSPLLSIKKQSGRKRRNA